MFEASARNQKVSHVPCAAREISASARRGTYPVRLGKSLQVQGEAATYPVRLARKVPPLLPVAFDGASPRQRHAVGPEEDDPLLPAVGVRPARWPVGRHQNAVDLHTSSRTRLLKGTPPSICIRRPETGRGSLDFFSS
jgi:hypothetical protein